MNTRLLRIHAMMLVASSITVTACADDGSEATDDTTTTDDDTTTTTGSMTTGSMTTGTTTDTTTTSTTSSGTGETTGQAESSSGEEESSSTGDTPEPYPFEPMANGANGYTVEPIFTVGETISKSAGALNPSTAGDYTPVGILDGIGATELNDTTVRIFMNHELLHFRGYEYTVPDGKGATFTMRGARVSYFDIDKATRRVVDSGLAINQIYDAAGEAVSDASFFASDFDGEDTDALAGFSRFCSSALFEAEQFGNERGLTGTIYFTGEENGSVFDSVGGGVWALDVTNGDFWHVPAMGRGAWENITEIDTGTTTHVAFLLADDTSPFDIAQFGSPSERPPAEDLEASPLYLYVGEKDSESTDFLALNGLSGGDLYVWVADNGNTRPSQFNGNGETREGQWIQIENGTTTGGEANAASEDGQSGFDEYGYPTQRTLWTRATAAGSFGFSRPEDLATNPTNGAEAVLASTGVDNYDVLKSGDGADTFGTIYTIVTTFDKDANPTSGDVTILYDGDADETRAIRSPDNLDWADDGLIYVQEDKAEDTSLSGEVLFGPGATNTAEASIYRLDPSDVSVLQLAEIDREVIIDPTTAGEPFDTEAPDAGEWETSGILDVSSLFDQDPGTLFLFNVQAHGIERQTGTNADSRFSDDDLREGGQLAFLVAPK